MNTKNEESTRLMRETAERKYEEIGERHIYTGLAYGLADVLRHNGIADLPPDSDRPWIRDIADELTTTFHSPLATYDPHRMTVAEIADGVGQGLAPDIRRDGYLDARPSFYDVYVAPRVADFDELERRAVEQIRREKLRRGSKRFDAFFAENHTRAVAAVRTEVERGIARIRAKATQKAERLRRENLGPLDGTIARWERAQELWRAMVAAGGMNEDGATNARIANVLVRLDALRTKREVERCSIEEAVAFVEKQAAELDADTLVRDGMMAGNRPLLANFWKAYEEASKEETTT